jgi:hypothetical protein
MKLGIHNPSWVYGPDPAEAVTKSLMIAQPFPEAGKKVDSDRVDAGNRAGGRSRHLLGRGAIYERASHPGASLCDLGARRPSRRQRPGSLAAR